MADPMTQTATVPRDMQPVSLETLTRAMREIALMRKPTQWIVIDPQGRMYRGTVEQMMQLLVREHPLMQGVLVDRQLELNKERSK